MSNMGKILEYPWDSNKSSDILKRREVMDVWAPLFTYVFSRSERIYLGTKVGR